MAYKIEQQKTIPAQIIQLVASEVLWEATRLNAIHGLQLSPKDKQNLAQDFYKQKRTLEEISKVLSVSLSIAQKWTAEIRSDETKKRNDVIWELYLQCHTQEDIGQQVGLTSQAIGKILNNETNRKITESFIPDSLQLYNLWHFQSCDDRFGMNYPGRIPGQIVENLLYYYTTIKETKSTDKDGKETIKYDFPIVVDPFGGGGTTIDVCKAMNRRYQVYDIAPVREDIKKHDITTGFPEKAKKCDFIFLDPPYFQQKKGEYSDHPTNLANLDLLPFYETMERIFESAAKTLKKDGYLAFIISSSKDEEQLSFHGFELAKRAEKYLKMVEWIDVPYSTQVHGGAFVKLAKEKKKILYLRRDLVVFQNGL
jgi:hypothetical protein